MPISRLRGRKARNGENRPFWPTLAKASLSANICKGYSLGENRPLWPEAPTFAKAIDYAKCSHLFPLGSLIYKLVECFQVPG